MFSLKHSFVHACLFFLWLTLFFSISCTKNDSQTPVEKETINASYLIGDWKVISAVVKGNETFNVVTVSSTNTYMTSCGTEVTYENGCVFTEGLLSFQTGGYCSYDGSACDQHINKSLTFDSCFAVYSCNTNHWIGIGAPGTGGPTWKWSNTSPQLTINIPLWVGNGGEDTYYPESYSVSELNADTLKMYGDDIFSYCNWGSIITLTLVRQ